MKAAPPKQTTLSFSSKSTNQSRARAHDVEEDNENDDDVSNENQEPRSNGRDSDFQPKSSASPDTKGTFVNFAVLFTECRDLISSF